MCLLAGVLVFSGCIQTGVVDQQAPEKPTLELKAELVECSYNDYKKDSKNRYAFFYKVWNNGELPTKQGAAVCLALEGRKRPQCIKLNRRYYKGQVLWNEIKWPDGRVGQEWVIPSGWTSRQDGKYRLYYTEKPNLLRYENIVLDEGSSVGCKTAAH